MQIPNWEVLFNYKISSAANIVVKSIEQELIYLTGSPKLLFFFNIKYTVSEPIMQISFFSNIFSPVLPSVKTILCVKYTSIGGTFWMKFCLHQVTLNDYVIKSAKSHCMMKLRKWISITLGKTVEKIFEKTLLAYTV